MIPINNDNGYLCLNIGMVGLIILAAFVIPFVVFLIIIQIFHLTGIFVYTPIPFGIIGSVIAIAYIYKKLKDPIVKKESEYNPERNGYEQTFALAFIFITIIAALSIHLYQNGLPLFKEGAIQPIAAIVYSLIGLGEAMILYVAIDSRISIYRINHPKPILERAREYHTEYGGAKP